MPVFKKSGELYGPDRDGGRIYTNWAEETRRRTCIGRGNPASSMLPALMMYFRRRPGRACSAREPGAPEPPLPKCCVLTALLVTIAACAILMIGGGNFL